MDNYCGECGTQLVYNADYCVECGNKISTNLSDNLITQNSENNNKLNSPYDASGTQIYYNIIIGIIIFLIIMMAAIASHATYTWTVVDSKGHELTYHDEFDGTYNISERAEILCDVGQDYYTCIERIRINYNSICAGIITDNNVCEVRSATIDNMQAKYKNCGYGCTYAYGQRGIYSLTRTENTKKVSNNDYIAEKTHKATCIIGFIGECRK
jgi:hypothetical protein